METAPTKNMTLIVLSGALLAAIAVALVIYFMPGTSNVADEPIVENGQVAVDNTVTTEFNTSVLQRTEYTNLDMSLFARGLLPVQPPAAPGKTNLFR